MAMFSNVKVGDRVYSWTNGWGTITGLSWGSGFPIGVRFDNGIICGYTVEGFNLEEDANPVLFWDKPQFEIPKKPFNLKKEYKKLKRVNFIQDKENFYLIYYGDDVYSTEKSEKWNFGLHDEYCSIGTTYYSGDNLSNFIKLLNDNKITFEQLEQVIKEVEDERV